MKQKRVLAMSMATIMAFASTGMVFAEDVTDAAKATGSVDGTGTIEGYTETDVFTVTLPTTKKVNFKIDPQELLKAVSSSDTLDGIAFSAATAGYGKTVLFQDETSATKFTTKSADISVVNKSTFDVDVDVTAKVTGLTKEGENGYSIALMDKDAEDFAFGTATALTLSLTPTNYVLTDTVSSDDTAGTATALTNAESGVSTKVTIQKSDKVTDAYEFVSESGSYKYKLKADVSTIPFKAVKFNLAGTVNTDADWTNFSKDTSSALKVDLTYSVSKHVEVTTPVFTAGTTKGTINYTSGSGDTALASIVSIKMTNRGTAYDGFNAYGNSWPAATKTDSVITFSSKFLAYFASNATTEATITYTTVDGNTATATVMVKTSDN
ncbi:MAG: hypothetical protein ACLR6A_00540 [Candidatus Gastranaerophilaceae bacterium]